MTGTDVALVANWLAARSPSENDMAVIQSLGEVATFAIHTEWDGERARISAIDRPRGITQAQIDRLRQAVNNALTPAAEKDIVGMMAELDSVTKVRSGAQEDLRLRVRVLTERLGEYPADVTRAILKHPWDWFPSLGELVDKAEPLVASRRALKRILETWGPWTLDEEIKWLEDAFWRARYDSVYGAEQATRDDAKDRMKKLKRKLAAARKKAGTAKAPAS